MVWFENKVLITSTTCISSSPILYITRFWGLAPYSLYKNDQQLILKRSLLYTLYSYIVGLAFVYASFRGLLSNLNFVQAKGEYVFYFIALLGNVVTIVLIFGAPFRMSKLFAYIGCMNKIDSILKIKDSREARRVSVVALCMILLAIALQNAASTYFMAIRNPKFILEFLPNSISQSFIPIVFECQYAHVVYCVQRRIRMINSYLEDDLQVSEKITLDFRAREGDISRTDRIDAKLSQKFANRYGLKLAKVYSLLCDAVENINESFGCTIGIVIVTCLVKVTQSLYFVIFMMLQKYPLGSLVTQMSWAVFDIFRVFVVVETCDRCLQELNKTSTLAIKLFELYNDDHNFKAQIKILLLHLDYRKFEFSVYGLGTFNHKFLTKFMSTVTTYLVIIIQFNQSFNS